MERHDTDPLSLLFGVVALAAGAAFFFGLELGNLTTGWILPAVLVAAGLGVAGATLALTTDRGRAAASVRSSSIEPLESPQDDDLQGPSADDSP